jgi:hypothetical protein
MRPLKAKPSNPRKGVQTLAVDDVRMGLRVLERLGRNESDEYQSFVPEWRILEPASPIKNGSERVPDQ